MTTNAMTTSDSVEISAAGRLADEARLVFEPSPRRVRTVLVGETVADSSHMMLLHEKGHLPVYYFPQADVAMALLQPSEDLTNLDPSSVQTLLRNVEKGALALGLKGASENLRDLFFSNMSERAGKILREDMEAMGPVRLSEVDDAQTQMINKAKELAASGEIVIAQGGGEDELVY